MKPHKDGKENVMLDGKTVEVSSCDLLCLHASFCPMHEFDDSVCRCNTPRQVSA